MGSILAHPDRRAFGRRRWSLAAVLVLTACPGGDDAPPEDPTPVVLAVIDGWTRVTEADADVFADMRPADTPCDESGVGLEQFGLSFEVKTDLCNYVTVAQPTLVDLAAGDTIQVRTWHDILQAPTPGQGYLGLALDGDIIWAADVPIPGPYDTINADVVVDRDVPAGAELQYHVHNHGVNSWNILDLKCVGPGR